MSIAIQCDKVKSVLLSDGWHVVHKNCFGIDTYEFLWNEQILLGGGSSGVCASGFYFNEVNINEVPFKYPLIAGPLTSIIAVQYSE